MTNITHQLKDLRNRFLNWVDAFWGYDVFIAHRRADAADYAQRLYRALQGERISCFIDRAVYGPGDSLDVATERHVKKSTLFVLVGSPELLGVRNPDWVEEELTTYLASHEADPKVMPIDFGGTIANALLSSKNPILRRIETFVWIQEALPALDEPPSEAVLSAIRRDLGARSFL